MAGSRINAAKSTLQLFLRSLPEGVIFNIVGTEISMKFLTNRLWQFSEMAIQ